MRLFIFLAAVVLILRPLPSVACSYLPSPNALQRTLDSPWATDIVIGTIKSLGGERRDDGGEDARIYRVDTVTFSIEHTLKGELSGDVVLAVEEENMCAEFDFEYEQDNYLGLGVHSKFLVILTEQEDGRHVFPFGGFPFTMRLDDMFDIRASPLMKYIADYSETQEQPVTVAVAGPDRFEMGQAKNLTLAFSEQIEVPLVVRFPEDPYAGLYGGSFQVLGDSSAALSRPVELGFELVHYLDNKQLYKSFLREPLEPLQRGAVTRTIQGSDEIMIDLDAMYDLQKLGFYALEGYFRIPISATQNYVEWWGRLHTFTLEETPIETHTRAVRWGSLKAGF